MDRPEQIEAERMGGSGDGRWASSSSVADTRGCDVVCCVRPCTQIIIITTDYYSLEILIFNYYYHWRSTIAIYIND